MTPTRTSGLGEGARLPAGASGVEAESDRPAPVPGPASTTGGRFVRVVGGLTSVNVLIRASSLITGPLMARALGPAGRGDLAAILVPFGIVPLFAMLGLAPFVVRQIARGRSPGVVVGTVSVPLAITGAIGMVLALPASSYLAGGDETVRVFLAAGFFLLPVALAGMLLQAVANGFEAWRSLITSRLIPPVGGLIGVVSLYLAGELTVATAATVAMGTSLLSIVPLVSRIRPWQMRPRVDREVLREGTSFGMKAWANQLASSANARLDQLIMIPLVPRSELGLYAVGVNAASVAGLFTTALAVPLAVRIARGETALAGRALRMTLLGSAVVGGALALLIPFVLPLLFGESFADASTMAQILLAASVPNAGRAVLAPALTAAGHPGAGAMSQTVALIVTVPALLLVLPSMGGVGAALVSLATYTLTFLILLPMARRHLRVGFGELLVPRVNDIRWAWEQLRSGLSTLRTRRKARIEDSRR